MAGPAVADEDSGILGYWAADYWVYLGKVFVKIDRVSLTAGGAAVVLKKLGKRII